MNSTSVLGGFLQDNKQSIYVLFLLSIKVHLLIASILGKRHRESHEILITGDEPDMHRFPYCMVEALTKRGSMWKGGQLGQKHQGALSYCPIFSVHSRVLTP